MLLKRDGGEIAYDYINAGDGQPPVLLLHGALGVRAQFDGLRKLFPERSQLALDFPSHGESPVRQGVIDAARLADDVLALLDTLAIEKVDIIGHSMGGYVALVMAQRAPSRVNRIVTLGTKFYWSQADIDSALTGLDGPALQTGSQRYYDSLAALHAATGVENTLAGTRAIIGGFARWQLSEEMVRACGVPVMIAVGDRDAMVPVADAMKLFGALGPQQAAVAVIPRTPHPLPHLPLECFAQLVRRFWEPVRARAA